jgi:GNAT superfamily N-acetyltransferase
MESVRVEEVKNRSSLNKFIRFNYELYRGNRYAVPELYRDMVNSFNVDSNAALEFCDMVLFIAYRGDKVAGRIAGIINRKANAVWNKKSARFGWIDFVDDPEVSKALIYAVEKWGRSFGMTEIEGPLGFTDFDPEGMLTEGFDQLGTMSTIYNYPYYPKHMESLGFQPSAQWVEWQIPFHDIPEKMERIADVVLKRYDLHLAHFGSSKGEEAKIYAKKLFALVNEAYAPLYGYSAFSERQIDDYVDRYLPMIDKRLVIIILDKNEEPIAAGLIMPSLSRALQKAGGKFFPLGWWHLAKALWIKPDTIVDLMFLAIKPEYQNKGLNSVMFNQLIPVARKMGFLVAESNPELETNDKMQAHWSYFEGAQIHKRRKTFVKNI